MFTRQLLYIHTHIPHTKESGIKKYNTVNLWHTENFLLKFLVSLREKSRAREENIILNQELVQAEDSRKRLRRSKRRWEEPQHSDIMVPKGEWFGSREPNSASRGPDQRHPYLVPL